MTCDKHTVLVHSDSYQKTSELFFQKHNVIVISRRKQSFSAGLESLKNDLSF